MFSEIKRLFTHSIVYGAGHLATRIVGFALLPVYAHVLKTSNFGDYALLYMFLGFANVIYIYGFDSAFLRFYLLEKENKAQKDIFSTAYISLFSTSFILSSLIFIFSARLSVIVLGSPIYSHLFKWASGILFFDTIGMLGFLYLRAKERSLYFVSIKFINALITVTLNVVFVVVLKKGVDGIIMSNLAASAITAAMLIPVIHSQFRFVFSKHFYKELMK